MRRFKRVLKLGVCLLAVAFVLAEVQMGSRAKSTCVLCRLDRTETTLYGLRWVSYRETECSTWYRANLDAGHAHLWEWTGCRQMLNGFSQRLGWECRATRHPIYELPAGAQVEIYQHFPDPAAARRLFAGLVHPERVGPPRREDWGPEDKRIVDALAAWWMADFPTPWLSWWSSYDPKTAGREAHPE